MTAPYYQDENVTLWHGDCLDVLRGIVDNSVDAVVTDPPYALEFMGRGWDKFTPLGFELWCSQWAAECLRVLKPGGHLLAFGGTRTWHRLAAGVEDAGFEIRDNIAWLYGSGFPKSLDVSKAIDKAAGADREVTATERSPFRMADPKMGDTYMSTQTGDTRKVDADGYIIREVTAPATDEARTWAGWGTALKPAFEPIVAARKPLAGTVAHNVTAHGTGALNIDASRVGSVTRINPPAGNKPGGASLNMSLVGMPDDAEGREAAGRWPANVLLTHAYDCGTVEQPGPCVDGCPVRELDQQSGVLTSGANPTRRGSDKFRDTYGEFSGQAECAPARGADSGGASRFFPTFRYEAKAPTSERPREGDTAHPTVKPLALMQWLVRLVTPPGGTVLEPFAGSGTTAEACVLEGFTCIAIEREATYLPLIVQRLSKPLQPDLFGGAA